MATRIDTLGMAAPRAGLGAVVAALPRWLMLLATAIAVRAVTFGNPLIAVDEQFYWVTAQRMLHGALPFVDIWDRKPIGLFLLYLPAAALGMPWGILAYQLSALACVVLTAGLIARIADRVGWGAGAMPAALLYILMLNVADGQGGQAPVFYNLLTIAAVALMLPRADDRDGCPVRVGRNLLAMLLIGLALQVKYTVLFEGLFLGLWLLWREARLGAGALHVVRRGIGYAGMAMLPTLLAAAVYVGLGHFDAWFYANFGSILDRRSDPFIDLVGAFFEVMVPLAPLLVLSTLGWMRLQRAGAVSPADRLLIGWLIAAMVGLIVFGSWYPHYALPAMVPASLCCAAFFAQDSVGRRIVAPVLLGVALIAGTACVVVAQAKRGSAAQLATLSDAIGRDSGCLYVHSGDSMLYGATGRCALSPWLFPSHLSRERENGALGVDQIAEVDRIFAKRPAVVVMRTPFRGERIAVRTRVQRYLHRLGYVVRGTYLMGTVPTTVYAAPDNAPAATPGRLASRPA
ncbi:hypothetical protein [Sphingomonas sp. TDK1]|uniref:hypothetical protein n=1 Tax=Sphingomonas sp. TDK1 TaxID=453247 RepID=UPI0007D99269|nr:hypothetical protein [Sphingomonas sp. TDK1]OAN65417.1 hypothetical protein A7X12_15805 [Sphingomonas sp. TDK1]